MVSIEYVVSSNAWAEGAWAEVLTAFALRHNVAQSGDERVLVQPKKGKWVQGDTALPDFSHPANVVYCFGPDDGHLPPEEEGEYDHKIYIPQVYEHVTLWSHQAAAIVLYDRAVKNGDY